MMKYLFNIGTYGQNRRKKQYYHGLRHDTHIEEPYAPLNAITILKYTSSFFFLILADI